MYVCFYNTCRNIIYNANDIKAVKRKSKVYYLKVNCEKLTIHPQATTIKKKKEWWHISQQRRYNGIFSKTFHLIEGRKCSRAFKISCQPEPHEVDSFWNNLSSVQSLSPVQLFVTPWTAACQASMYIINSWSLLKLMSIEMVMPSTIISSVISSYSCRQPFPASGSFPMSQLFASGGQNFSFNISPSNE